MEPPSPSSSQIMPRIIDGGTGTELERQGVPMHGLAWSAEAVLSHPDTLREVHTRFLEAGAEILIANTFSAGLHVLKAANLHGQFETINARAVELVKQAVATHARPCVVAGALSTTTFSGALDYSRLPKGEAAVDQYARQAAIQVAAGAERMILEMMRDIVQTRLAIEGVLKAGVPVWLGFSCVAREDGVVVLMDTDIPLRAALAEVPLDGLQAVGVMHTLVEHTNAAVAVVKDAWRGPVFAYPHAGHFVMPHWVFHDVMQPQGFAEFGLQLMGHGVDAVGGCCGISPAHIRAFRDRLCQREGSTMNAEAENAPGIMLTR